MVGERIAFGSLLRYTGVEKEERRSVRVLLSRISFVAPQPEAYTASWETNKQQGTALSVTINFRTNTTQMAGGREVLPFSVKL